MYLMFHGIMLEHPMKSLPLVAKAEVHDPFRFSTVCSLDLLEVEERDLVHGFEILIG